MTDQEKFDKIKEKYPDKFETLVYSGFVQLDEVGLKIVLDQFGRLSELNDRGQLNELWKRPQGKCHAVILLFGLV
jgi:hypothetical protein